MYGNDECTSGNVGDSLQLTNWILVSVSVGNTYSEYQLMHTFLDNFHRGGKYSDQISSHQAELRKEGKFTDQKSLSISSLQTDYLNLDSRSGFGRNGQRKTLFRKSALFVEVLITLQKNVSKVSNRKGKILCDL